MRYEIRTSLGVKLDHAPSLAGALIAARAYDGVVHDTKTGNTQCGGCGLFKCRGCRIPA